MKTILIALLTTSASLLAEVISYNFPPEFPKSERYEVRVDGQVVEPLQTERGAILNFGMRQPVRVEVQLDEAPGEVAIRPLSAGIKAKIKGNTFSFVLSDPRNLSVEVDGDLKDPLLVFANPPERDIPSKNDPKVHYYEAGKIHEAGEILLDDDETLYMEPGAVVNAVVRAVDARNVSIRGGGILNAAYRKHKINQLVLRECVGARLEDFIILDSFGWTIHLSGSEQVELNNVRVVAWRANCDGLDIEYSSHVRVERCFFRTYDDSIAVKALYPPRIEGIHLEEMIDPETLGSHDIPRIEGATMGDILVTDTVFWNDAAQSLEIGFELRIDRVKGITFRDCDVIHAKGAAVFSVHNGDDAVIEDLLFEDIRVENVKRLLDFQVGLSIYSDDCPEPFRRSNPNRRGPDRRPEMANNPWQWYVPEDAELAKYQENRGLVRNVVLRNIQVLEAPEVHSMVQGYNEAKAISDLTFVGLTIAGKPILSEDDLKFYAKHTRNIRFLPLDYVGINYDPVIREIEGWTVYVDPKLMPGGSEELPGQKAMEMLGNHFQRIAILIPEEQLRKMRTCEIWLEHMHPHYGAMGYHPDEGWLLENKGDPRLEKKVHITNADALLSRYHMLKHPAVILHELAHAYHDIILGFDEPRILEGYERVMQAGLYDRNLLYNGDYVKHYGGTDHKEYFAESTEAYFYKNDFYPFVAAELKEHDPETFKLMEAIWGPLR